MATDPTSDSFSVTLRPGADGPTWAPGPAEHGLHERVELACLDAGRVAVREAGPGVRATLVFTEPDWHALLATPTLLDLR